MISTYKDLHFWQTSREVSFSVAKLVKKYPSERAIWIITDQVLRASFSVGANIAEGFGKYRGKEYVRFLDMALGSANETEYWLELVSDLYPQFKSEIFQILSKNKETIKMLTAAVNSLRKRKDSS